jgi:hypothetical protein
MSIASVTSTSTFPQSLPGIQPYAAKSGDSQPTSQTQTTPRHHPAPPWGPGSTAAATSTASVNTLA